jgi:hypothetical protein
MNIANGDMIREYDGFLGFDPAKAAAVRDLVQGKGAFDVGDDHIEIRYNGRDTTRFIIAALKQIAEMVGYASGLVTCTYQNEDEDPRFEFYTIENGKLYVQKGAVVREPQKVEC